MSNRKVSSQKRLRVFERAGFTCEYCGAKPPGIRLTIDHKVPLARGGTNDDDNLACACKPCNEGKADRTIFRAKPYASSAWHPGVACPFCRRLTVDLLKRPPQPKFRCQECEAEFTVNLGPNPPKRR